MAATKGPEAAKSGFEERDLTSDRFENIRPGWHGLVVAISVAMCLFHLWVLLFYPLPTWVFRSGHLTFALVITLCLVPVRKGASGPLATALDLALIATCLIVMAYVAGFHEEMSPRAGASPEFWDIVIGTAAIAVLLEGTRRLSGWPIVILVLIFLVYGLAGSFFPGPLVGRDYSYERVITFVFSLHGIYGVPLNSSAVYVFLFILFGSFLQATGASKFFIDLALGLSGRFRGGPAKVAIVASSFFGTMAGSSTANVVVTGTFTIPMMIRTSVPRVNAGATEAVASTGGQLVPPIMGAGAFLMAEILGIPYGNIIISAIFPAFLYYVAVFILTDLDSAKRGLVGLPRSEIPPLLGTLARGGHLLLPLVVLVVALIGFDLSPYRAAMYALLSNIAISFVRRASWLNWRKILDAMVRTAGSVLEIATTTASAGIIVGVLLMTGMGGRFASIVVDVSQGNLDVALVLTMFVSIVLGMGMPSVAAYAVAASVAAPGIIQLGVPPLAAHMFVFYFASISAITPPVALASFAAASLSEASLWKVSGRAMVLGMAGYLVPYVFVHETALLLIGDYTPFDVISAVFFTTLGFFAVAAAVTRWFFLPLARWQQIVYLTAGVTLIELGFWTDVIGIGLLILASLPQLIHWVTVWRERQAP